MHFSRVVSLERKLKGVIPSISCQLLLAIVKTSTFFQIFLGKRVKRKYVFTHSSTYHTHIHNFKNTIDTCCTSFLLILGLYSLYFEILLQFIIKCCSSNN